MGRQEREIAYQPLPSQKLFHECDERFKGFSGPIGSGKSQALCQEAIRLTYQNAGRMGLLGAPTFPMLRDSTQVALFEVLERNQIPYDFNRAENTLTMRDTGSKILFRSLDDYERLRGTNLAWFGVDELTYTQEAAWLRLEGRLRDPEAKRLSGFAVWTPKGYDWVYRRFIEGQPKDYRAILARPKENHFLLDQIPDFYERLKHSYDESFYQQEVLGEYLNAQAGRVYRAFDRREHVISTLCDAALPLLWALDFNVDPMSSVVVQKSDGIRVVDEIVLRRATTLEACQEFCKRYGRHGGDLSIYGDAAGQHMQTTGSSDYQIVQNYFGEFYEGKMQMKVPRSNPSVRDRISLMNAKLKNSAGTVELVMDPRCVELIRDFEQVTYKPDSMVVDKDKDHARTHLTDALGYLLWQEFRAGRPAGPGGTRIW